jgi:hypothetical protein
MNALLEQLHDIEGLDAISPWPLAIGWWVLILLGLLLFVLVVSFVVVRVKFKRSWKNDTLQKLRALENNLSEETSRETVITLSEYLKRIALRRFSRKECAGLMGEAWLKWLKTHDIKNFDWVEKGGLLIRVPYSPEDQKVSLDQVKILLKAAKEWVR